MIFGGKEEFCTSLQLDVWGYLNISSDSGLTGEGGRKEGRELGHGWDCAWVGGKKHDVWMHDMDGKRYPTAPQRRWSLVCVCVCVCCTYVRMYVE